MREQQLIQHSTTIRHTLLIADFSTSALERLGTILQLSLDLSYPIIPFTDFNKLCKFLAQTPTNITILIDLSVITERSLTFLHKLSNKFPTYDIIAIIESFFTKKELSLVEEKVEQIIFRSDLNSTYLNQLLKEIVRKKNGNNCINDISPLNQIHYQAIINNLPDATFLCNMKGDLLTFNSTTADLLEIPLNKLSKTNIHSFIEAGILKKLCSRLQVTGTIQDYTIEIKSQNGIFKYCIMTAQLIDGFDGYTATIKDITEQRKKETQRQSQDLARKSAKMKEQFLASVSHEMRTPMNAILGMSNLALQTTLNEEQYNYINSIKHSSQILLGVVNDILQISEIQNEKIIFDNKDFDLHELLYNLINVMQYKVKEKNLGLELLMAPGTPKMIRGDSLRLNQILYNLVGNAIKFTDAGQVKVHVINLNQNEYSIQLKFIIEDTGIGIPKERLDNIFDSFARVQTKDRIFEGTGLGLAIAKSLIQLQGGKIDVQSELGVGSRFFFDLIFEVGEEIPVLITKDETSIDYNRSFKLLLVEDHKMNQIVARKTLEKQWKNIQLTIVNHGREAIDILEQQTFDIILMDIQMPVMDGYETTEHIRKEMPEKIAKLPILAMTAHVHISQDENFKKYGMNDFVLKPFNPQQLFQKINQYLPLTK